MEKETIDILIATYNSNLSYLEKQLNSIINQSYKNIKILISDDCSSKIQVKSFLTNFSKKDSRISLFFQDKNLGYNKNFEFLLTKSTSNYVMFCDQDDIWYPSKVQKSFNALKENNVDLVYCDAIQINAKDEILTTSYINYKNMPKYCGKNNILPFSRHIAIGCSQIFTKKIKEKMLPFKNNVFAYDWLSLYLANKNDGVFYLDEPLLKYRTHDSNVFGGRNLSKNLFNWKNNYGKNYKSYKNYRSNTVIDTFLLGSSMCFEYSDKLDIEEKKVISYYKQLKNTKIFNISFFKYFKYLYFKKMGKRFLKEFIIFHFPPIGYLAFLLIN